MAQYTDVDECAENNGGCSEHATCTNIPDSFYCTCYPGYTGDGFTCTGKTTISPGFVWLQISICISLNFPGLFDTNMHYTQNNYCPRTHVNASQNFWLISFVKHRHGVWTIMTMAGAGLFIRPMNAIRILVMPVGVFLSQMCDGVLQ